MSVQHFDAGTPRALTGACDACKRRKVKCDARRPCANCCISQIPCEHRTRPRKRGRPAKSQARGPPQDGSRALTAMRIDEAKQSNASFVDDSVAYYELSPLETGVATSSNTSSGPSTYHQTTYDNVTGSQRDSVQVFSPSWPASSRNEFELDAVHIFRKLSVIVNDVLKESGATLTICVRSCIDLFLQYQFPNTPIAHEQTLRQGASLFEQDGDFMPQGNHGSSTVETMRSFTLLTALCALVSSTMSEELLPRAGVLVWPFYHSSRAMLKLYEEVDLESPQSSSYCIRIWHSAALQNTTGRDWASWHIHGEGTLLAMRARIYDEAAISALPPLEAQLLRLNFWLMYLADKTAAAFEARPYVINEECLAGNLTLRQQENHEDLLLDPTRPCNQNSLESRLLIGFHLKRQLWAAAADTIRGIRLFTARRQSLSSDTEPLLSELNKLIEMYSDFVGLVDDLPSWLQSPHGAVADVDGDVAEYQVVSFWAQRSNIMSVYHCMRLVILQKCSESGLPEVVGLNDQPVSWAIQKLEIARDFLRELQMAPFVCFKVQGESAVERVRRVGGVLLSILNDAPTPAIEERARGQLDRLLDVLTKLDSKASDDLEVQGSFRDLCQ